MKSKKSVAVIIPAFNEAKVIHKTLEGVFKVVSKKDVFIIDDGSIDSTGKIAKKSGANVLRMKNGGKAHAINAGIKHFKLTKKYEFIFFMDADSYPKADFLKQSLKHFKGDSKKEVICVIGRVKVSGKNWISKYRQWEYLISYLIHKKAQEYIGSILVTPGCATLYRSFIFDKLEFPGGTLTEDMDFTFLLHRAGYNKMKFENKAVVFTLDPLNLKDYIKQLNRWYTGFWQVIRKHDIPWGGQVLDLEVCMLALEGLYNGVLVICFFIFAINFVLFGGVNILIAPFLFDLVIFFIPSLLWSIWSDKDYTRIFYVFHFYFLRFLSSIIFLKSFFDGFLSLEKSYIWDSNRERKEGNVWRLPVRK